MNDETAGDEFVRFGEARRRLGVSDVTLRQRVRRGELRVFRDPRDHRRRLVRVDDLAAFARPRPIAPREGNAVPA